MRLCGCEAWDAVALGTQVDCPVGYGKIHFENEQNNEQNNLNVRAHRVHVLSGEILTGLRFRYDNDHDADDDDDEIQSLSFFFYFNFGYGVEMEGFKS